MTHFKLLAILESLESDVTEQVDNAMAVYRGSEKSESALQVDHWWFDAPGLNDPPDIRWPDGENLPLQLSMNPGLASFCCPVSRIPMDFFAHAVLLPIGEIRFAGWGFDEPVVRERMRGILHEVATQYATCYAVKLGAHC